jgi:hypothetical protein
MARKKKQVEEGELALGQTFETDLPTQTSEEVAPREKLSFTPIGILAILLGLTSSLILIFSTTSEPHTFTPQDSGKVRIELTLTAKQFLNYSEGNACDGSGELSGLRKAQVRVTGDGWRNQVSLGAGDLNTKGECLYTPSFQPPESFNGGKVTASVIFSFGESEDFSVDLGETQPYKNLLLSINLG